MLRTSSSCAVIILFGLVACSDEDDTCDPVAGSGCDDGLVCEVVSGGEPACFAPVVVAGRAFDFADQTPVTGARLVALDANGAPASSVAVSGADGGYSIRVPSPRTADGMPIGGTVTLRADAAGHVSFPAGVRPALPIDTTHPVVEDGRLVVRSPLTDIALLPLVGAPTGQLHGVAEVNDTHAAALIVAESDALPGAVKGRTAIADVDGDFRLFNLPPGTYTVTAYAAGHSYAARTVTLGAGQDAAVDLDVDGAATGSLSGSVQIVNPQGGAATSVILVVESTFDPTLVRGQSPVGLRAPGPGNAPSVTGDFVIDGVPAGRYVALAAFENDRLVRDASSIGGTEIVHQEVGAGEAVTFADGFKVTGAIDLVGPGADGPEVVTGTPTFRWIDDSSEDRYRVSVFDAYGTTVWEHLEPSGARDPSTVYTGPALTPGMTYQFRVVSIKDPDEELSRSEELRGVFTIAR